MITAPRSELWVDSDGCLCRSGEGRLEILGPVERAEVRPEELPALRFLLDRWRDGTAGMAACRAEVDSDYFSTRGTR